jgi:hypothetical protein
LSLVTLSNEERDKVATHDIQRALSEQIFDVAIAERETPSHIPQHAPRPGDIEPFMSHEHRA